VNYRGLLICETTGIPEQEREALSWYVYMVRCADDSLYTGIARDVDRRVEEHNSSDLLAANYTRARRPVTLVYEEAVPTRSAASKREYLIKKLTRQQKDALLRSKRPGSAGSKKK
jgi:putative endonuclease